jgi:hypothetical protein
MARCLLVKDCGSICSTYSRISQGKEGNIGPRGLAGELGSDGDDGPDGDPGDVVSKRFNNIFSCKPIQW